MLLYALGWYTPAFQVFYTLLPGISLYRRPADAVFLIGALGAILAGYAVHRLFTDTKADVPRQQVQIVAGVIGSAFLLLILLAVWRDRLPLLPYPLGISVLTFAAAGLLLYWVRLGITVQPTLAAILLAAFTTLDLAYHNGPTLASALPPSTYAVLRAHHQQRHHRHPEIQGRAMTTSGATASS